MRWTKNNLRLFRVPRRSHAEIIVCESVVIYLVNWYLVPGDFGFANPGGACLFIAIDGGGGGGGMAFVFLFAVAAAIAETCEYIFNVC